MSSHLAGAFALLCTSLAWNPARAQARADTTATPPRSTANPVTFSGVIFGSWQARTDSAARAATGGKVPNQFTIDRVYLTAHMQLDERASVRVTTDIYQNASDGYYSGWTMRLKFAYLQYELARNIAGVRGFNAMVRAGMLQTVIIDQEEQFWPRYLRQTGVDFFAFTPAADLGVAAQVSLPDHLGEIYGHVTNGPGYTSSEKDRFKDAALRIAVTPLANHRGFFQTLALSPWVYRGLAGSAFAAGGPGQVGPVASGLARNRWGVFAGVRDPRLTIGVHYARRVDGVEYGENTLAVPRTVSDTSGALTSAYIIARPIRWPAGSDTSHLGVIVRYDRFRSHSALPGYEQLLLGGIEYAPSARVTLAIDVQDLAPRDYAGRAPITEDRRLGLRWAAAF